MSGMIEVLLGTLQTSEDPVLIQSAENTIHQIEQVG